MLIFISNALIFKFLVPTVDLKQYVWILIRVSAVIAITVIPVIYVQGHFEQGIIRLIFIAIGTVFLFVFCYYILVLDSASRDVLKAKMKSLLNG